MNDIVISGNTIRIIDGLYCLNDLHRASGGEPKNRPSKYFDTDPAKDLVIELEKAKAAGSASEQNQILRVVKGGDSEQGTYGCKELVYSYAMHIRPSFFIHVVQTYDARVNNMIQVQNTDEHVLLLENHAKEVQHLKFHVRTLEAFRKQHLSVKQVTEAKKQARHRFIQDGIDRTQLWKAVHHAFSVDRYSLVNCYNYDALLQFIKTYPRVENVVIKPFDVGVLTQQQLDEAYAHASETVKLFNALNPTQ